MSYRPAAFLLPALVLAGCATFTMPYAVPLEQKEAAPPGTVLLVGQFVLDPPVKQGPIGVHAPRGKHEGVIKLYMTYDLRGKIDVNKAFGNPVDEGMDVSFSGLSVVPLAPGEHFIRMGSVMKSGVLRTQNMGPTGMAPNMNVEAQFIQLVRDIRIVLPRDAKAVYVGRIVFRHDGRQALGVSVTDDYANAMKDLAGKRIAGLDSKDVRKKLAEVIAR